MRLPALLSLAPLALMTSACATTQPIDPRIAPAGFDFASAPRVEVVLSDFDFTPRTLQLPAGEPIVLALVNRSGNGHNFAAPNFLQAAQVVPEDAAIIAGGAIEVPGGQTVVVRLVPEAGDFNLDCSHTGHSLLGMTGSIVVR